MIEHLFSSLYSAMTQSFGLALFAALVWGVLGILLSPCHLSSIPLVIGFIMQQDKKTTGRAFMLALTFSAGILVSIAAIGIITASMGRLMGDLGKIGKGMIEKLNYGKVAAIFWYPDKGAVRLALKPEFTDKPSPHEFFVYRKKGVEPSDIPEEVKEDIINMVLSASEDELFTVKELPDFSYSLVPGSFHKEKCDACGEYVFDRYLRRFQGVTMCIECAGYHHDEHVIHWPIK